MPDSTYPTLRRISHTPMRDVLRFRFTGRLDWEFRLTAANLPEPARELIGRVVTRTRLWRLEKSQIADELIAHFSDGLAAGSTVEQLLERFGDERRAAKLIRRAKRRARPRSWHAWILSVRTMSVVLAIYAVLLIRFWVGRPTPSVDYLAKVNAPSIAVAGSDRAWPLWRHAILACADRAQDGSVLLPDAIMGKAREKPAQPETVKWLDQHAAGIEVARQAGRKPEMGLVLDRSGPADDPELDPHVAIAGHPNMPESLLGNSGPHLDYLRFMALVLSFDAKLAAERGEPGRVEADITSIVGLSRQLRNSDGLLVTQFVALGVERQALSGLRSTLFHHPGLLTDEQLIHLAHAFSGPRVAADLIALNAERESFADVVQRSYTDDGHGDGHATLAGLRYLARLTASEHNKAPINPDAFSAVWVFSASRADVMTRYNRMMDQTDANFRQSMRQTDWKDVKSQIDAWKWPPINMIRFGILNNFAPDMEGGQAVCERYLGDRDGVEVGIALELYRRRHDHYPDSLSQVTPELLPEIPVDRITGDPVKYRLIDGKPVVYSVGADRIDDGGRPPETVERSVTASLWGIDPQSAPRGDWLLFAPDSADPEGN